MVPNCPKWSKIIDHKFNRMAFITRFNLVLVISGIQYLVYISRCKIPDVDYYVYSNWCTFPGIQYLVYITGYTVSGVPY